VAEPLTLKTLTPNQHFTEPPPRYSDASLIKELERLGIGRPSTYSPTIATIVDRKYVELQNQRFVPTVLGSTVNDLLVQDFANIVDYEFTSDLEKRLDTIAEGNTPWVPVVRSFYEPFNAAIVANTGDRVDVGTGLPCPKCDGGMLIVRFGRQGEFVGCNRYPDCQFTSDFSRDEQGRIALKGRSDDGELTVVPDVTCDICAGPMVMRKGRFGNFLACTKYPECRGTRKLGRDGKPVAPPEPTGVSCPKCTQGQLLARRGKFGRPFYGCNRYPQCDYLVNDLAEVANFDPTTASSATKPTRKTSSATKPTRKTSSATKPTRNTSSATKPARNTSSAAKPARKTSSATKPTRKTSSATKPTRKTSSAPDVVESVKKIVM
jgi:DNA topoisomerase-1